MLATTYLRFGVLLLSAFALTAQQQALPSREPIAQTGPAPLVFTGVTVIDVRDGQLRSDQTVVVVGRRVHAVGSARDVQMPKQAQVVDGRGKYLIPGLWDMHVHTRQTPQITYPLFIANGVTGVREMSAPGVGGLDSLLKWRREVAAGGRVGPRIVGTGGTLFSDSHLGEIMVTTPEEGRRAVDSLKAAGADFVKMHEGEMAREVYFAIAAEARRTGIPLVGHLPTSVTEIEASDSGQRSIDHFSEVHCWWPPESSGPPSELPPPDSAGEQRCAAVATTFARQETWYVPTLVSTYSNSIKPPDRSRYMPAKLRAVTTFGDNYDPGPERVQQVMRILRRFGMPILAGTDARTSSTEVVPGFTLHDELAFLVEAGLTPVEALQAATLNPAKLFNATDSLGTIAPGQLADLVLLDADPLADIHNTTKIHAVVANGRYFDRPALDALLTEAERAAAK